MSRTAISPSGPDFASGVRSTCSAYVRPTVCHCDERSQAVRRLLTAELPRFPDLIDIVRGRAADRVTEALADEFARLSVATRLRQLDPVQAAEQFVALLTGPVEARSRLGTRRVPDAELWSVTRGAVTIFLRAFAAEPHND